MIPPTARQADVLSAIDRLTQGGVPPTYREIMADLGMTSVGGFHRLLTSMCDRGVVTFEPGRARSLRIVGRFDGLEDMTTAELDVLRARIDAVLAGRSQ